jgi:Electron transfer DM13
MAIPRRHRWTIVAGAVVVLLAAFLAFRPDKLFVDDVSDEALSDAFTTTSHAPTDPTSTTVGSTSTTGGADVTTSGATTTQPPPTGPIVLASGGFTGIDHDATGTATVYRQDGTTVLRFEDDTDIQNGPDLFVWLLAADGYTGGTPETYLDLGTIKGNVGGQNYELPAAYDPSIHRVVLVWCRRFSVPFAAATLG